MPPELEDFSEDFQTCFDIMELMSDKWEFTGGNYLGKEMAELPYLFDLFKVDESLRLDYAFIIKYISQETLPIINSQIKRKSKDNTNGRLNKS